MCRNKCSNVTNPNKCTLRGKVHAGNSAQYILVYFLTLYYDFKLNIKNIYIESVYKLKSKMFILNETYNFQHVSFVFPQTFSPANYSMTNKRGYVCRRLKALALSSNENVWFILCLKSMLSWSMTFSVFNQNPNHFLTFQDMSLFCLQS